MKNGVPILGGPKLFTQVAANAEFADRALYDLAWFHLSMVNALQQQAPPPWGEVLTFNRPVGGGLFVSTVFRLPAAPETAPANDEEPVQ